MKDFYRILDLPQDATQQQIKDRYRQLVRIFHPDRYPKPEDKAYAEQKLQEINEAYEAIYGGESRGLRLSTDTRPPKPIVYPERIDLGSVIRGERAHALLQIDNVGGLAQSLSFHIEEGVDWFTITKGERMEPDKPLPMLLHIEARTDSLHVGQSLENWIDIDVHGVRARAVLSMNVVEQSSMAHRPGRIISLIGVVAVLLVGVYIVWNMLSSAPADGIAASPPTPIQTQAQAQTSTPASNPAPAVGQPDSVQVASVADNGESGSVGEKQSATEQATGVRLRPVSQVFTPPASAARGNTDPSTVTAETTLIADATASAVGAAGNGPESESREPSAGNSVRAESTAATPPPPAMLSVQSTQTALPTLMSTAVLTVASTPLATSSATSPPATSSPVPSPTSLPTPDVPPTVFVSLTPLPVSAPANLVTISVPSAYQINARAATTTASASLMLLDKGATFPAIARTIDNAWTQIVLPDGRVGWVFTASMVANLALIETLPVSVDLLQIDASAYAQFVNDDVDEAEETQAEPAGRDDATAQTGDAEPTVGAVNAGQTHQVEAGDFLKQLAQQYYADEELWTLIYEANVGVIGPDPNLLPAGVELTIPVLGPPAPNPGGG